MGTPGTAFESLSQLLGPMLARAFGALLRTVGAMALWGAVVTAGTVWLAAGGSWVRGAVTAGLALVTLVLVTGALATKNALTGGLAAGLEKLGLGKRLLTLLFGRLGVTDDSVHAERAGAAGRLVERLPLRDAEARLGDAVNGLLAEGAKRGGVRGWLSSKLLQAALVGVQSLTLARFRGDANAAGGLDLRVIRDELSAVVDTKLMESVTSKLALLNVAAAAGWAAACLGGAALAARYLPG